MKLRYTTRGTTGTNGTAITLENVRLTGFSSENQYDGDSFNRSGRRETITGTAIISGNPLTSSTGAIDVIRNSLNSPRGKLELQFDSATGTWYTLVDGRGANDSQIPFDARNGPLPHVTVSRIEGTHSAAVTFVAFSYTYFGCGDTRIQKFEMSVTQSLDEAGFITMTRSGSLKVSAGYSANSAIYIPSATTVIPVAYGADTGSSPDLYRNLVAGRPAPFFRRTRQDYTLDSSLTTLSFTIEDRMVFRELKYPVMMGDASFGYERSLGSGAQMLGTKTFSAQFEGGPDTPPNELLKVAIEAASARIDFEKDLIQSISVREPNIYSRNKIDLTVTAMGQSNTPIDLSVVRQMFTDPHPGGSTAYVSAYGSGGVYVDTVSGLKWDSCQTPTVIADVIQNNPDDDAPQSTLTVLGVAPDAELETADGTPITEGTDIGVPNPDNRTKHLDGSQEFDTQDSGMHFIEATGGMFQWPIQLRMPVVIVTQTVRYISNTQSAAVPYPQLADPFIVLNEKITVNNAPPDVTGKPVFAVLATRQIQVQTSSSPNMTSPSDDLPRRVWSPNSVPQARGLYSSNNTINARQLTDSGEETQTDYIA